MCIRDRLQMDRVIIPSTPGVFSALGLLVSDVEHEVSQAWLHHLTDISPGDIDAAFSSVEKDLTTLMATEGFGEQQYEIRRYVDLRYSGQAHELTVACPSTISTVGRDQLAISFGNEHERTYGHQAEAEAVECVTLRAIAGVTVDRPELVSSAREELHERPPARSVYFGPDQGQITTPVISRNQLSKRMNGPLIVEEYDATCVVPPRWQAELNEIGNIVLTREGTL